MIRIENVSKSYRHNGSISPVILCDINLAIPEGQFVCILGPSGCGKTTLLNLIAGFIKPSGGQILFNGMPVTGPGPDRGVVFQDSNLFPWLSARKNVEFGLRQLGLDRTACTIKAQKYLDLVGMRAHADTFPHTLSGGMRQRVAIARALALEPKALLMDEPFSNLDANAREHHQDEVLRIWQNRQRTMLYVTHSVEEAAYLADRVIVMGPTPNNVRGDMTLSHKRPRRRSSPELRALSACLRSSLDTFS